MLNPRCDAVLTETKAAYRANPALMAFARFPDDLSRQDFEPNHRESCTLMCRDTALSSNNHHPLLTAIFAASADMHWRETYKDAGDDTAFMDRWGCFSIIGDRAPFVSQHMRLFIVYMPARLLYPWHRHPAEEMYLVLSGAATFKRRGLPDTYLSEGQTMFHATNEHHALETRDSPVLCLVAWRNHLTTMPVLVPDPDS